MNNLNNPIYRWNFGSAYRGYLICPVDSGFASLYGIAVFNPFGQELADEATHQLVSSVDEVWQIGRDFVDRDLVQMSEEAPSLVEFVNRECAYV